MHQLSPSVSSLAPVRVGKTDMPLRPDPTARGPLPSLACSGEGDNAPAHLLDGPPYANGAPHLGHVLNKHLKDAVARALEAQGHATQWRPGWDCHGLPLELALERQGVARHPVSSFVAAARAHAQSQVDLQAEVFTAQGWMTQWEKPWTTMDPAQQASTLRVFARLVESRRVQVRHVPVPWCAQCQSTVAGAEQEDRPVKTMSTLVPFELSEPLVGQPGPQVVLSWTSTPWTVPLNQLLAVDPGARFVALSLPQAPGVAWVSEHTASRWVEALGAQLTGRSCRGEELVGRAYRTPWGEGVVVGDARALADAGTGVLHAVFGLAELDSELVKDHGLAQPQHLTPDGQVQHSPMPTQNGLAAGPAASRPVLEALSAHPWCLPLPYASVQPHCWRHGVPLLTRASRQVFVVLDDQVRATASQMVAEMAFTPESARSRLVAAMTNRPDWCVSRQRSWGVPVALFLDRQTGQPHARAAQWMSRVADAVAEDGVEAWWQKPSATWLDDPSQEAELDRVDDVLDVWFDSGCAPQHFGSADVVVEGVDQHRGWFQACVWVAASLGAPSPFARVVSHGFVVDAQGNKLSKSTGGDAGAAVRPGQTPAWSALPTDVVRLWALSGGEGMDKAWSAETVRQAQACYARLRGLLRFMVANALPDDFELAQPVPDWDAYWVHSCAQLSHQALGLLVRGYSGQALTVVADFAERFSSQALGSWKDRLYCAPPQTGERQQLDAVLKACLASWAPLLGVLTPRLMAEAQPFVQPAFAVEQGARWSFDVEQVQRVLEVRRALGPVMEKLAQHKLGPMLRALVWEAAPHWPDQLLADALDVGHMATPEDLCRVDWTWVSVPGGKVGVGPSPHPVCPRCRRAQPSLSQGVCRPCTDRSAEGASD